MVATPVEIASCGEPKETGRPFPEHLAGVDAVGAGEHLDERRLAGAVLPEQAVHLAGAHREVDAVQGPDTRDLLDDPAHRQQGGLGVRRVGSGGCDME